MTDKKNKYADAKGKGKGDSSDLVGYINCVAGPEIRDQYSDDYEWLSEGPGGKSVSYGAIRINQRDGKFGTFFDFTPAATDPVDAWTLWQRAKATIGNTAKVNFRLHLAPGWKLVREGGSSKADDSNYDSLDE